VRTKAHWNDSSRTEACHHFLLAPGRDKKEKDRFVAIKTPKIPATPSDWPTNWIKELKVLILPLHRRALLCFHMLPACR
jgi:hypothetical protein